jgi:hypothetical protein
MGSEWVTIQDVAERMGWKEPMQSEKEGDLCLLASIGL